MHTLQGHDNWVRDLSFATFTGDYKLNIANSFEKGDLMLASASQDKYIRLWKISSYIHTTNKPAEEEKEDNETGLSSELLDALKESALQVL